MNSSSEVSHQGPIPLSDPGTLENSNALAAGLYGFYLGKKRTIDLGRLIIEALVFLSVIAWVGYALYSFQETDMNITDEIRSQRRMNRLIVALVLSGTSIILILIYNFFAIT